MIRATVRLRSIRVVVVVLVCLLVSPFAGADDYSFFHEGPADTLRAAARISPSPHKELTEESDETNHVCACVVCTVALGESFSPVVTSPQAGELLAGAIVRARYASHLPDIYRPPIA
ncbi:MAG: hypothetical protein C4529_13840 [Deltaproteobacteria bacterium]|nr:MAG: hypothetical protein C4529_13840 [Deltaproteobacteria bacterium]